ncbi:hypothetical protein ACP4OV_010826 [Aristida adscensionis]
MGKAGRWLRTLLSGRRDARGRDGKALQHGNATATPLPAAVPREKKRWSFRRAPAPGKPAAAAPSPLSLEPAGGPGPGAGLSVSGRELDQTEREQSEHAVAVAAAAAVAADAAVEAAAQAAAAVARLTADEESDDMLALEALVEEAAAVRIQATFRGYLARKALCALRGLVKLQALIRGQLVRRQANATLRRMQALVSAQSRLRAQRARMLDADHAVAAAAAAAAHRRSPQHPRRRSSYEMDRSGEEHVRIVEMDMGGDTAPRRGRSSCSAAAGDARERRLAEYYYHGGQGQCSPAPSSVTAAAFGPELISPRAFSGHLDDVLLAPFDAAAFDPAPTSRSSPYVPPYAAGADDEYASAYAAEPGYMANTESSRAKARSQSAPRQRTADALERQPSRRRGGAGAGGGRSAKMQRSSSHIGAAPSAAAALGYYQYYPQQQQQQPPWAGVRLDRSSASLVGSECGSTSSVLTAATVGGYCRSLVGFEVHRGHY